MVIFTSCSQCDGEKGKFNPEKPPSDDAWCGRKPLPYHLCYANVATMTRQAGKYRVIKSSGPLRCVIVCLFWIVRLIIRFAATWIVVFSFLFTVFSAVGKRAVLDTNESDIVEKNGCCGFTLSETPR